MTEKIIAEAIQDYAIIPMTALDSTEDVLKACELLTANGLPILEVSFRNRHADEIIRQCTERFPDLLVGAGTILTPDQAEQAKMAGAAFAAAPGFNKRVVDRAQDIGLPVFPGVCSPTDVEAALAMGVKTLNFFPAEAVGGVKMLKALLAAYKHTGVQFIANGGIHPSNATDYLKVPEVLAVSGCWILDSHSIYDGNWEKIAKEIVTAVGLVKEMRG